jgi:hypothetical protein
MTAFIIDRNEKDLSRIIFWANQLGQGRSNATGTVTLTANAASTTVTAINCAEGSQVFLSPKTANAAAALATTYVSSVLNGSFVLTHANNAQADKTFGWVALG